MRPTLLVRSSPAIPYADVTGLREDSPATAASTDRFLGHQAQQHQSNTQTALSIHLELISRGASMFRGFVEERPEKTRHLKSSLGFQN